MLGDDQYDGRVFKLSQDSPAELPEGDAAIRNLLFDGYSLQLASSLKNDIDWQTREVGGCYATQFVEGGDPYDILRKGRSERRGRGDPCIIGRRCDRPPVVGDDAMSHPPVRHLEDVHGVARGAAPSAWRTHRREPGDPDVRPWAELTRAAKLRSRLGLLTTAVLAWAWNYLKFVFRFRHRFPTYQQLERQWRKRSPRDPGEQPPNGIIRLQGAAVALAGDWGSGTWSAYQVAKSIICLQPDYTIHLGDVYYSGTENEFAEYFLPDAAWPRGEIGTFALNGNHEMYSGGGGYFRRALPRLGLSDNGKPSGQNASYFCLENDTWRILAIDTGYYAKSFPFLELLDTKLIKIHRAICRWLQDVVFADPEDRRPVILLSHHNWFSAYDSEYRRVGRQMLPYLGRVLLWFWGHEHRFSGYESFGFDGGAVRARCIGHGGIPFDIAFPKRNRQLVFSDERVNCDSTNHIAGRQQLGYCGFALLRFDGERLTVGYYDETYESEQAAKGVAPPPLLEEQWTWDRKSGIATGEVYGGEGLTKYVNGTGYTDARGRQHATPPQRVCSKEEGNTRIKALGGTWRLRRDGR